MQSPELTIPLTGAWMEERSLLVRAKSGDSQAFEQLLKQHERSVLSLCRRILGNSGDAEEAAQDAFFRLYKALPNIDETRAVEPWLFRTTANLCKDRLRQRRPSVELKDHIASVHPQATLEKVWNEVREALAKLPDRERAALILREIDGLETEEVAREMGTSATSVRTQISRARAKLRLWLGASK